MAVLSFLQVEGSYENREEDDTFGCHMHGCQRRNFLSSSDRQQDSQFLFFERWSSWVPAWLNHSWACSRSTTIPGNFMNICDDRHFYTIIPRFLATGMWSSAKIISMPGRIYQRLAKPIWSGRRYKTRTRQWDDLVELLGGLHAGTGLESEEVFYPQISRRRWPRLIGGPHGSVDSALKYKLSEIVAQCHWIEVLSLNLVYSALPLV
jgi:hypothetical protein